MQLKMRFGATLPAEVRLFLTAVLRQSCAGHLNARGVSPRAV